MYYGQFLLDRYINDNFIKNQRNGFFVECGAFDGRTESSCLFFEETLGWKGVNIEAVPHLFNLLKQNRPNILNLNLALSDRVGEKIFTHVLHPQMGASFGNGSFCLPSSHRENLAREGCSFQEIPVSCQRFDNLFRTYNFPEIDLFVLDVEGYELEALRGIVNPGIGCVPKLLCVEYPWCGLENLDKMLLPYYNRIAEYQNNAFFSKK